VIPQRVFQTLALISIPVCLLLAFGYAGAGGEPFVWIASTSATLSALCTLLSGLVLSLGVIVPLRLMSDMKPIREELADVSLAAVAREKEKLEAMRTGSPEERRRYHLRMAAASFCCLLVGGPILSATLELGTVIFALPVALVIYGVFGPPVHLAIAYAVGRKR
jgi:hypothetical protein